MPATLLHGGMVVCLGQTDRLYDQGFVLIEDDWITAVGDQADVPSNLSYDERIDCSDKLIMPGLINAHTHTPMTLFRGRAEMIRTGTTTFADQYFYMDQVVPAVRRSGLRGALAYGIVELGDPVARERELARVDAFLEDFGSQPGDRLKGWVGPHAFFVDN